MVNLFKLLVSNISSAVDVRVVMEAQILHQETKTLGFTSGVKKLSDMIRVVMETNTSFKDALSWDGGQHFGLSSKLFIL